MICAGKQGLATVSLFFHACGCPRLRDVSHKVPPAASRVAKKQKQNSSVSPTTHRDDALVGGMMPDVEMPRASVIEQIVEQYNTYGRLAPVPSVHQANIYIFVLAHQPDPMFALLMSVLPSHPTITPTRILTRRFPPEICSASSQRV